MRLLGYLLSGLVFGAGLALSGMLNSMKVRNFLDVASPALWDPSLIFVMGGAMTTAFIGYRLIWRRGAPLADSQFHLPPTANFRDGKLIGGSALFGVGWGLAGLCPGPAVASLGYGATPILIFVAAMLVGMFGARLVASRG